MQTKKRILALILTMLLVMTSAAGTGCGGDAAPVTEPTTEAHTETTAPASTEPAATAPADTESKTEAYPETEAESESESEARPGTYSLTSAKMPYHIMQVNDALSGETEVYFINGSDVPYLEIEDWIAFQSHPLISFLFASAETSLSKEGYVLVMSKSNGTKLTINFLTDVMWFDDYNNFLTGAADGLLDLIIMPRYDITDGSPQYLSHLDSSVRKYGHQKVMDLGYYDIDLVHSGDRYLIPLQTLSDLFLTPYGKNVIYNGECIYVYAHYTEHLWNEDGTLTETGETVYGKDNAYATGQISKTMAKFNYDELCFAFDNIYGLKENHHILGFRDLVREKGFEEIFLGTDSRKIDEALCRLVAEAIDDGHTKYEMSSVASGIGCREELIEKYGEGRARANLFSLVEEYTEERAKYYPEGVPAYEEIGDTAFITFDQFDFTGHSYYVEAPKEEDHDTIAVISTSVQQILRPGSPIKNVVLDLSCNIGGTVDSAIYTLAAFLGTASISVEDPNTGALATNDYLCDTNFDKKYDENDTLAGKGLNLYCLESGISFSCGNLVPAVFKEDPHVSLLGQRSAGGACSVTHISTATGAILRLSSSNKLSYLRNGSFYDIDQGVEPDFFISKVSNYYDRESLAEYIDDLK